MDWHDIFVFCCAAAAVVSDIGERISRIETIARILAL